MSESSDARFVDALRADRRLLTVLCLAVGSLLLGAVSLVVHHVIKAPASPYHVAFSTVGDGCDRYSDVRGLVLDESSGEILYCGVVPGFASGPAGAPSEFTSEETIRVTDLAKSLASGGGLDDEEQGAVKQLAREIAQKHGYPPPTSAERVTWQFGGSSLAVGVLLFVGLGWMRSSGRMCPGPKLDRAPRGEPLPSA